MGVVLARLRKPTWVRKLKNGQEPRGGGKEIDPPAAVKT